MSADTQIADERPAKRPKTLLACESCRKSKVRCAPTAVGCQRCTTARKTCSLTGSPLAAYNQSTAFLPSTSSQLNEGPSPALLPPIPDANDLSPAHTDASDGTTQATFVDGIRGVVSTAGTHQFLNPFRDLAYASSTGSPGMPEKVEMTTSTMLLLRPLTLAINLLTHDPHNYGKASGTSARDVRWLLWPDGHGSGAGSLEDVFSQGPSAASIETLQRFATWTTKADPRSLLNQLALASSAIVMARGLGYEGPEATKEQKLQLASLRVTEAALLSFNGQRPAESLKNDLESLLASHDSMSPHVQLLMLQADLFIALGACSLEAVPKDADDEAVTRYWTVSIGEMETSLYRARLATHSAPLEWRAYYDGICLYGRFCYTCALAHAAGYGVKRAHDSGDDATKLAYWRIHVLGAFGSRQKPAILDYIQDLLSYAAAYPSHLATAPDVIFVLTAWVAALILRIDMTTREWFAHAGADRPVHAQLLRQVADAFLPTTLNHPLSKRTLAARVGRLCRALVEVMETSEPLVMSLEELLGPTFFDWPFLFDALTSGGLDVPAPLQSV